MKINSKVLLLTGFIVAIASVFVAERATADGCTDYCQYNPNYACVISWPAGNTTTCYYGHSKPPAS